MSNPEKRTITVGGRTLPFYSFHTLVVGTGAAGLNGADSLFDLGVTDLAIVTEGINFGTSRNAGSDKQTYYKLSLSGEDGDSPHRMAQSLYRGGSMHKDTALAEAAESAGCFFKLERLGVPFPRNRYGEYVGYRTDHDDACRATSCGPLTSREMVRCLERSVEKKHIPVFNRQRLAAILTASGRAAGLLTVDTETGGFTVFSASCILLAAGGPAAMYRTSVYPESQTGATGCALEAGAAGANLTESQYGLASVGFRWNLSGTYQQVLPRYFSCNPDGSDPREFLTQGFPSLSGLLAATFRKGYQWPFDPAKVTGSSLIDLLVYRETRLRGRKVYLDFTRNPKGSEKDGALNISLLEEEPFSYLSRSEGLKDTPIARLEVMNAPAAALYRAHGIDLARQPLEIDVCAQHNNGGLSVDLDWQTTVPGLFAAGEICGTFGVTRPGGSALNSTQAGSLRAARRIARGGFDGPLVPEEMAHACGGQLMERLALADALLGRPGRSNADALREFAAARMSRDGACVREGKAAERALAEACRELEELPVRLVLSGPRELSKAFLLRDILVSQIAYLGAIGFYISRGGASRGSYLVLDPKGQIPSPGLESLAFLPTDGRFSDRVLLTRYRDGAAEHEWEPVREITGDDHWFERVWKQFREGQGTQSSGRVISKKERSG